MIHTGLPIEAALPEICRKVETAGALVLTAEPGAGKSTVVPLALCELASLQGQRIVMLEPRRIAVRAAARRMAQLLGEQVGQTVGFRTRFESAVSKTMKIEVVTEAVLTGMMRDDPSLDGVGLVVFDEFHERSLHADLALTLALEVKQVFRPDLKLVIMSATMDAGNAAVLLGENTPVVHSAGRCFDVPVHYSAPASRDDLIPHAVRTVKQAVGEHDGDALVFLPGEAEIRRMAAALNSWTAADVEVLPLYGNLPAQAQDMVFQPHPGTRRIILATPVAETSITIPGVRIVVDTGLMRKPFFSPSSGMDKLRTVRIPKASAEQRRGRAGRSAAGVCWRLWHEFEQNGMADYTAPEMEQADLTEMTLELAEWGIPREDVAKLRWMTPPPEVKLDYAYQLLFSLGATDARGMITAHGKRLHEFPVHPRLAHAVLFAEEHGAGRTAIELAAILSDRDPLISAPSADLGTRLNALHGESREAADGAVLARMRQVCRQLQEKLPPKRGRILEPFPAGFEAGLILAAAFPDRIGRRRENGSLEYVMSNGLTAKLRGGDGLREHEYLVIADAGGTSEHPCIFLALPVNVKMLERFLPEIFRTERRLSWDDEAKCVRAFENRAIGSVTVARKPAGIRDDDDTAPFLLSVIRRAGIDFLPFSTSVREFVYRIHFLHCAGYEEYPDCSDETLLNTLEDWLAPYLAGISRLDRLQTLDFRSIFASNLAGSALAAMDKLAPERFSAPGGSRIRIDYADPKTPVVRVKLQEVFGLVHTPKLAGGRVPLTFDLLSPAMRTVQITSDLDSFWDGSYFLVRKDMRGRYPKHNWPEDPRQEPPSRSTIRKRPEE